MQATQFSKENNVRCLYGISYVFFLFSYYPCKKLYLPAYVQTYMHEVWIPHATHPREKLHKHERRCRIVESSRFTYIMAVPTKRARNISKMEYKQRVKLSWYFIKNFDWMCMGLFTISQSWRASGDPIKIPGNGNTAKSWKSRFPARRYLLPHLSLAVWVWYIRAPLPDLPAVPKSNVLLWTLPPLCVWIPRSVAASLTII